MTTTRPQIILFNAPPTSGKDYLADRLGFLKWSFATKLKNMTHGLYGLTCPANHFEDSKDIPNNLFYGLTPRAAYIKVAETLIKPAHGKDFFGKHVVKEIEILNAYSAMYQRFVITDAGFLDEVQPVLDTFGKENVLLVKIHTVNNDWSNDSRRWLNIPGVKELHLTNSKDERFVPEATAQILDTLETLSLN